MKRGFVTVAAIISAGTMIVAHSETADAQSEVQAHQTATQESSQSDATSSEDSPQTDRISTAEGANAEGTQSQSNKGPSNATTEHESTGNQRGDQNAPAPVVNTPTSPTPAAEMAAPESVQKGEIETVVVTARRTAEDIQKVPVAITAYSEKDLEREKINTSQDLAGRIPSLVINSNSQGRNNEIPQIRGQGAVFGGSPGVIIYYGEVPLPSDSFSNNQGGPGKFFDLENLQVLKGSQGTLFGRNTTGGALVLSPHKPDPTFSASIRSEVGDYEDKGVEGIINIPIIEDTLLLRAGAKFYERGGFSTDAVTGERYDNKGFRTFRLGLTWKPADDIENYLLGYYTHSADNGTSEILQSINDAKYSGRIDLGPAHFSYQNVKMGCLVMAISGSTFNNCGHEFVAAQNGYGIRAMNPNVSPDDLLDTQALVDSFSYKLGDEFTLRNIASYSLYKHSYRWDMDGSPIIGNELTTPTDQNSSNIATYTEELQLQGKLRGTALKLVTGIYYETLQPSEKLDGHELGPLGSPLPQGLGDKQVTYAENLGVTKTVDLYAKSRMSFGPYAQATYDLGDAVDILDGLNVTAGMRYSIDNELGESEVGTYVLGFLGSGGELKQERVKTEAITWTAGLDYKLATTLVYGKVSHGYKAGGFSVAAVNPDNLVFKPELVDNYEIGHKSDFTIGEMPVRLNSAVYYTNYTDMQQTAANAYTSGLVPEFGAATYNAGGAKVMGFETEGVIIPAPGLTLALNYSYSYGKFTDYTLSYFSYYGLGIKDCRGTVMTNGAPEHLECIPFTNLPKHQASANIRYQLPVSDDLGSMEQSVTYSFTDSQYSSSVDAPFNDPGAWIGPHGLLNANFDWRNIYGSSFDLQLFGTNLTDRTYRIGNSNVWTTFFFQSSIYGEPRMYGLQIAYHWN